MSSLRSCKYCGSQDIDFSDARGETICCQCGAVLEENAMVEGLQFMESSGGMVTMVGQFIPSSGANRGFTAMYSRESRELVLQRGYHNIQWIADRLRLSNQLVESAQRIYLMAVQRNFTMGRNNRHVASSCLYIICRRERTPHLLIDFSDIVQTSVRTLGQIFMKLLRLLHFQIPNIDPSLFMERFASQMSLGDKLNPVAYTGVRLIQAMTRDWICTGRRPTGLCGSALLISARYHGFHINAVDIAHIVRIGGPTLMRRLSEFQHTSTAQLTAEEFESADLSNLPILRGPPCYEQAKRKSLTSSLSSKEVDLSLETGNEKSTLPTIEQIEETSSTTTGETSFPSCALSHLKGKIALDVSKEELCKDNPTSADITHLAGRVMDAVGAALQTTRKVTSSSTEITSSSPPKEEDAAVGMDYLEELLKDVQKHTQNFIPEREEIISQDFQATNPPMDIPSSSLFSLPLENRSTEASSSSHLPSSSYPLLSLMGKMHNYLFI
ncbi:transcription initiation factor TFIIIB [Cardiosporidium cionae]|uniref:Transcription initiation factor TFIIIB n=1 Tax=Cardiosporidium cionae TaxID=476202 RepID=A0ABQ7JCB7_9APIC|nr:transcription initiation factor TFIIIB [Cardiosporidium cionae]|eukprot:KAF8821645.1 transcription initiation factor TFIIIB [Cardiosporidium cionae]